MINTSSEYKSIMADNEKPRNFTAKAPLTLANNTVIDITEADILRNGLKFEDGVSNNNSFQIGSAIVNVCTLILNNIEGKFNPYDFTDAVIRPYVGLRLSQSIEWLKKGVFTVYNPTTIAGTVILECKDNMQKFERPFKNVAATFPITAFNLLDKVCLHCQVTLETLNFLNKDFTINRRPNDEAITCREIVSYIAQIAGSYARCNADGELELKWYDIGAFEIEDNLNGGVFDATTQASYQTGDNAYGGNFTDYNSGDNINGGTFSSMDRYHHIYALSQSTISTDDTVITGVQVKAMGTDSDYGETSLFGSNGYVIEISENPLIQVNTASIVANSVGAKIVGMRFRTCNVNALADPSREAGDVAYLSDKRGNCYQILLSNFSYAIGKNQSISCDAETPSKNQSVRYGGQTKTIIEARNMVNQEKNARELAIQSLAEKLSNSKGLFHTEETLQDGSKIYYLHDKPTVGESQIIWKMNAEAIAVSTDGGKSYPIGMSADGDAIAKRLSAIGVDAEWIKVLTSFKVGDYFSVDSLGKLITLTGIIGGFEFSKNGLRSNAMELLDSDINPLIWLRSADGSEHANYEGSLSFLMNGNGSKRQSILMDSRLSYLHGIELVKEDITNNNDFSGTVTERVRYGTDGISKSGGSGFTININGNIITFFSGGILINSVPGGIIQINGHIIGQ